MNVDTLLEPIRILIRRLASLRTERADITAYIAEATEEGQKELTKLQEERSRIEDRIEVLREQIRDMEPIAFEQLENIEAKAKKLVDEIRSTAHNLPIEALTKGLKVEVEGITVSVSKVTTVKEYRVDELLLRHPHLAEVTVDGDPLIERRVNDAVMERLLARGDVTEEQLDGIVVLIRTKAPAVSIGESSDA
jgi:hypothetical protein